jgi:hypothetical protein
LSWGEGIKHCSRGLNPNQSKIRLAANFKIRKVRDFGTVFEDESSLMGIYHTQRVGEPQGARGRDKLDIKALIVLSDDFHIAEFIGSHR